MSNRGVKRLAVTPALAILKNMEANKQKQFSSGRVPVFVRPSLYRTIKLTSPWDVGGLGIDDHIKNEMGQWVRPPI